MIYLNQSKFLSLQASPNHCFKFWHLFIRPFFKLSSLNLKEINLTVVCIMHNRLKSAYPPSIVREFPTSHLFFFFCLCDLDELSIRNFHFCLTKSFLMGSYFNFARNLIIKNKLFYKQNTKAHTFFKKCFIFNLKSI